MRFGAWAAFGLLSIAAAVPRLERALEARAVESHIDRVRLPAACAGSDLLDAALVTRAQRLGPLLSSWETVSGCGAGASTGTGAGVKWVGRGVTGGLFQVQCQTNYVHMEDGYTYAINTLVNRDLGSKWNLGVSVPWLYKYWRDPFGFGFDLSNEGVGDVNVLLTRRVGPINATSVTAMVGIPTGGHDADYKGSVLRQDKQMGLGRYTGGLIVDHTIDNIWGPIVLGGTAAYRGGENELESYRAPNGALYAYAAYLMGPFAPAAGLSVNGFLARDRDQGREQEIPLVTFAANASIEWATEWFALLVGGSLPVDIKGELQPWVVAVGISLAPF